MVEASGLWGRSSSVSELINQLNTTVFIEKPLASLGSANNKGLYAVQQLIRPGGDGQLFDLRGRFKTFWAQRAQK